MATDTHHTNTSTTDEVVEEKMNERVTPTEKNGEKGTEEQQPTAKEQSAVETLLQVQEEQPKKVEAPADAAAVAGGEPLEVVAEKKTKDEVEGTENLEAVSAQVEKPVSNVPQVTGKFEISQVESKTSIEGGDVEDKGTSVVSSTDQEKAEEKVGSSREETEESCASDVIESVSKGAKERGEDTSKDVEPSQEQKESGLEVKDREHVEASAFKLEEEKPEEVAKPDVQGQELPTKKADESTTSSHEDLPKEVLAKLTQKQSNNILSKVKQSLVKAKKAIIGKSPGSKTLSSETK